MFIIVVSDIYKRLSILYKKCKTNGIRYYVNTIKMIRETPVLIVLPIPLLLLLVPLTGLKKDSEKAQIFRKIEFFVLFISILETK